MKLFEKMKILKNNFFDNDAVFSAVNFGEQSNFSAKIKNFDKNQNFRQK